MSVEAKKAPQPFTIDFPGSKIMDAERQNSTLQQALAINKLTNIVKVQDIIDTVNGFRPDQQVKALVIPHTDGEGPFLHIFDSYPIPAQQPGKDKLRADHFNNDEEKNGYVPSEFDAGTATQLFLPDYYNTKPFLMVADRDEYYSWHTSRSKGYQESEELTKARRILKKIWMRRLGMTKLKVEEIGHMLGASFQLGNGVEINLIANMERGYEELTPKAFSEIALASSLTGAYLDKIQPREINGSSYMQVQVGDNLGTTHFVLLERSYPDTNQFSIISNPRKVFKMICTDLGINTSSNAPIFTFQHMWEELDQKGITRDEVIRELAHIRVDIPDVRNSINDR